MTVSPGGTTPPDPPATGRTHPPGPPLGPPGVRVGVIGVGMIGQDHIRRITQVLTGGAVVAVNDVDAARAGQVAAEAATALCAMTGSTSRSQVLLRN